MKVGRCAPLLFTGFEGCRTPRQFRDLPAPVVKPCIAADEKCSCALEICERLIDRLPPLQVGLSLPSPARDEVIRQY